MSKSVSGTSNASTRPRQTGLRRRQRERPCITSTHPGLGTFLPSNDNLDDDPSLVTYIELTVNIIRFTIFRLKSALTKTRIASGMKYGRRSPFHALVSSRVPGHTLLYNLSTSAWSFRSIASISFLSKFGKELILRKGSALLPDRRIVRALTFENCLPHLSRVSFWSKTEDWPVRLAKRAQSPICSRLRKTVRQPRELAPDVPKFDPHGFLALLDLYCCGEPLEEIEIGRTSTSGCAIIIFLHDRVSLGSEDTTGGNFKDSFGIYLPLRPPLGNPFNHIRGVRSYNPRMVSGTIGGLSLLSGLSALIRLCQPLYPLDCSQ